jgi:molybdopterin-guanine dinucleotide biosynthesis protein A
MLTVVIQAGGESRRMGQDKALVPFLGQPLVQRVLDRIRPLADEVIVTTNRQAELQFLKLPLATDLLPGRGALGGLYTALSAAGNSLVAVVACDMPFVSASLLAAARDMLSDFPYDAVIPNLEGGSEPFHAVYRRSNCLPLIEAALQAGKWRVNSWFDQANLRFLTREEVQVYDPQGIAFLNLNTPEEVTQAELLAGGEY